VDFLKEGAAMQRLKLLIVVAVLLSATHFVRTIRHFLPLHGSHDTSAWVAVTATALIDFLVFVFGVVMLIPGKRPPADSRLPTANGGQVISMRPQGTDKRRATGTGR
jgi:hypothetical protein